MVLEPATSVGESRHQDATPSCVVPGTILVVRNDPDLVRCGRPDSGESGLKMAGAAFSITRLSAWSTPTSRTQEAVYSLSSAQTRMTVASPGRRLSRSAYPRITPQVYIICTMFGTMLVVPLCPCARAFSAVDLLQGSIGLIDEGMRALVMVPQARRRPPSSRCIPARSRTSSRPDGLPGT